MSDSTLLELNGITLGDYSCRGLTMTLTPIANANGLRRTVNGTLLDLTAPQFQKYAATITCEDLDAPTLVDVWQGKPVTVTCVPGLNDIGGDTTSSLVLDMMVDSWNTSRDEYASKTNWTLNLLEV
jgi:hypothetical protein